MNRKLMLLLATLILLQACASAPVTGRKQLMIMSEAEAIAGSKEAYVQMLEPIRQEGKLDSDKKLKQRVDLITGKLITQAIKYRPDTTNWEWSVHVIDDPNMVNAWCMAGGRMAVYTGLIQQINPTDDELAQVMGHEIAHALAKHTAEKMSVSMATNMATSMIGGALNNNELVLKGAAMAANVAIGLPNSRTAESEADRIGIEIAAKAGYDPNAAVSLWKKMGSNSGGANFDFLSTHPAADKRMNTLASLVPKMMSFYQEKVDRPVFQMSH